MHRSPRRCLRELRELRGERVGRASRRSLSIAARGNHARSWPRLSQPAYPQTRAKWRTGDAIKSTGQDPSDRRCFSCFRPTSSSFLCHTPACKHVCSCECRVMPGCVVQVWRVWAGLCAAPGLSAPSPASATARARRAPSKEQSTGGRGGQSLACFARRSPIAVLTPRFVSLRWATLRCSATPLAQLTPQITGPAYNYSVKMTCGGCSGAIERVLKKNIEARE